MGIGKSDEVNPIYIDTVAGQKGTLVSRPPDSSGEQDYVSIVVRAIGDGVFSLPMRDREIPSIPANQLLEVRQHNPVHPSLAMPDLLLRIDPDDPNGPIGRYTASLSDENRRLKSRVREQELEIVNLRTEVERAKQGTRQMMAGDNSTSRREPTPSFLDRW